MNVENHFDPGYWNSTDLKNFGFKKVGENVLIAKNITIIGISNISLGNNIRIDGYTVINANRGFLNLGDFIHIGGSSFLACAGGIEFKSYSTISQGVKIYSVSDDYSGNYMTNPLVPKEFTNVDYGLVTLSEHVIVGSGSVLLPNTTLLEGTAVGALTLVNRSIGPWGIYAGVPAKLVKARSKEILNKQKLFEQDF
jgi:acetyltransferase-like isoleucine patch superfamily enzyme